MHQAYRVKLLHSETYLVESISNLRVSQQPKAAAVLPHLIPGAEHLGQKVKINWVLKSGNQLHRRHLLPCLSIIIFNLIQRMLLQKHVRFSSHVLNLHYFTDFECIILMWKLLMINLENLREITIT